MRHFDVLIVGSGLAGMTLALHLAETRTVGLITKKNLLEASSSYAQGGIAAVLDTEDSVEAHIQDTLVAGAGLCNADTTRFIVENSRAAIDWLIALGVPFTRDASAAIPPKTTSGYQGFHLTREGGHSHRRIIHAADATGEAVTRTLGQKICAHPNITVLEDYLGIDLITAEKLGLAGKACFGIYALDKTQDEVVTLTAGHTILATGGAGKVYLYTTNPDTATGDGIAMGWRAGCRVANMEFIQFHPTCLYHPHAKSFLVSEAVRGEGGILRLPDGTRFMPDHDPRAELVRRLLEYEQMKLAALTLDALPQAERDFAWLAVMLEYTAETRLPEVCPADLKTAWMSILARARHTRHHTVQQEALSVREQMSLILRQLAPDRFARFESLFDSAEGVSMLVVCFIAILELAKEGLVVVVQDVPYQPIYVRLVSEAEGITLRETAEKA